MTEIATLAGGCFWCTEAIFERLRGVTKIEVGYVEGIESAQISFDPKIISYETLLSVFFRLHDPTTKDKQGADVGPQYRSAIFYHSEEQKKIAEKLKSQIKNAVTEISKFTSLRIAEVFHQHYYDKNSEAAYCKIVIDPKIEKLYKEFKPLTKDESN